MLITGRLIFSVFKMLIKIILNFLLLADCVVVEYPFNSIFGL